MVEKTVTKWKVTNSLTCVNCGSDFNVEDGLCQSCRETAADIDVDKLRTAVTPVPVSEGVEFVENKKRPGHPEYPPHPGVEKEIEIHAEFDTDEQTSIRKRSLNGAVLLQAKAVQMALDYVMEASAKDIDGKGEIIARALNLAKIAKIANRLSGGAK
jgi:hypothetical protein